EERKDAQRLRTSLQKRVRKQKSVTEKQKAKEDKTRKRNGEDTIAPPKARKGKRLKYRKDWKGRLKWVDASTRTLVYQLIERVEDELPGVSHIPKHRWYYFYKGESERPESLFAVLTITKRNVHVRVGIDSSKIIDKKNLTKPYKNWFFKTKVEERDFTVNRPEQLDYALELLQQSYSLVH
ncbi:MAG: hypothetical protein ACFFCW_19125, partial [Candidatus Hodarchaeota archaeon]